MNNRNFVESTKSSFHERPILNALYPTHKTTGVPLERRLQWPEMMSVVPFSRMLGRVLDEAKFKNS